MSCFDPKLLADHARGRLEAERSASIKTHIAECAACKQALARIESAQSLMREIADAAPPDVGASRGEALARWTRPGGWMSHQVDFTCLETATEWNGHRAYGELAWKLIAGKRPYFVSREPLATHVRLIDAHGFDVVRVIRGRREGGIRRRHRRVVDDSGRWRLALEARRLLRHGRSRSGHGKRHRAAARSTR